MEMTALILASIALMLALIGLAKSASARNAAEDAASTARRHAGNVQEALETELAVLRSLLERLVGGEAITPEMVREGILWADVDTHAAQGMIEAGEVNLLDVRTPQETSTGIIPGALLLPMDEVEERLGELPQDKPLLVYCAGGGRSAAVCEFLAGEGRLGLLNLTGGFGAWSGPVERPEA